MLTHILQKRKNKIKLLLIVPKKHDFLVDNFDTPLYGLRLLLTLYEVIQQKEIINNDFGYFPYDQKQAEKLIYSCQKTLNYFVECFRMDDVEAKRDLNDYAQKIVRNVTKNDKNANLKSFETKKWQDFLQKHSEPCEILPDFMRNEFDFYLDIEINEAYSFLFEFVKQNCFWDASIN